MELQLGVRPDKDQQRFNRVRREREEKGAKSARKGGPSVRIGLEGALLILNMTTWLSCLRLDFPRPMFKHSFVKLQSCR